MKFNELKVPKRSAPKRVGRGIASGKGKTAGRGTKGQGARAGYRSRPGFEGGQNPLMQRLPKLPGFKNHNPKALVVHTGQLEAFGNKTVDSALLAEHRIIDDPYARVKLLVGGGELTKKVNVKLQSASANAIAAVQKAGGTVEIVPRAMRASVKSVDTAKTKSKH